MKAAHKRSRTHRHWVRNTGRLRMRIVIPGKGSYDIHYLLLDMNGTIGLDGALLEGVADRLARLPQTVRPLIATADTHGGASLVGERLGIETVTLEPGDEAEAKLAILSRLGAEQTVAVGNGANDVLILKESAVGICVLGQEGASAAAALAADVLVHDIRDALDLLLHPQRLVATLRS